MRKQSLLCVLLTSLLASASLLQAQPHVEVQHYPNNILERPDFPKRDTLQKAADGHGFAVFTFHDFPKKRRIFWSRKRQAQWHANQYQLHNHFVIEKDGSIKDSFSNLNTMIVEISGRYLPGEKVTHRFHTTTDGTLAEITYTPNPINVVSPWGELLAEVHLEQTYPAVYTITVHANEGFHIKSDKDKQHQFFEKGASLRFTPHEKDKKGGEGIVNMYLSDGSFYRFAVPWGEELIPYLKGEKKYSLQPKAPVAKKAAAGKKDELAGSF